MARLRVKEIAERQGLTATDLMKRSNVGYNVILDMMNKPTTYNPRLETLERIATALGVSVHDLIESDPMDDPSAAT